MSEDTEQQHEALSAGQALPSNLDFIRVLGEGSMAQVILARNKSLKRLVAVKILDKELADDPIGRKRFVREAQAAARISHPSVTSVFSVGDLDNATPYIEMEYVEGSNLDEALQSQGKFDVAKTRRLLAQLAGALAAAHDNRIIHRDVKPANVLLDQQSGDALLTDFGVAGILETGSEAVTKLTREGSRVGNLKYMSPEQLRGETLTGQTDIYSLGVLAYELLTLDGPFANAEVSDMAGAHLRRAPYDLHTVYPDIPGDLSDVLKRCLSKRPEHRPRAADLVTMLEKSPGAQESEAAAAMSSGALGSFLYELKKRHVYRAAVAYAAVIFVVLQVADLVLPPLDAPEWIFKMLVVSSLAGFPIVVTLAWAFDLRKGRLMRAEEMPASVANTTSREMRLLLQALGLLLSILLAATMAWWLLAPAA